jgi:AraC-like DNA-binding protein
MRNSAQGIQPEPAFFSARVSSARRFYLNLNPPRSRPLSVVSGGSEHCRPDYTIQRATFPYFSLEFVSGGKGCLRLRGRRHPLQPGSIFTYGPDVQHQITTDPDHPLVKYFINFVGTQASAMLQMSHLEPGRSTQVFAPHQVQWAFDELIRCGLEHSRHAAELCAKLLEYLVLRIADARAPFEGAECLAFSTYQHCRQHIQDNFRRLATLHQIAQECHLDPAYLCRLFKRYDHQSPYQYLLRLKLNQAAELLEKPGMLVKQAAEQAGFSDPFHFSRAFKGAFGVSPNVFRTLR